jgi:hypothetical protein
MIGTYLVQINRAKFVSADDTWRVEYFIFRGGKSEWIISKKTDGGFFSAIDHADTLQEARAKYVQLVKAVA